MENLKVTKQKEHELIKSYQETGDTKALHVLIKNYKSLIAKEVYRRLKNYPTMGKDLNQEAVCGLMYAIKKFDLNQDVLLGTYAKYWVKVYINKYLMNNSNSVKFYTLNHRRRLLFFKYSTLRKKYENKNYSLSEMNEKIAKDLNVPIEEVTAHSVLSKGDYSMDYLHSFGDGTLSKFNDSMVDFSVPTEDDMIEKLDFDKRRKKLREVLNKLPKREREVFIARKLKSKEDGDEHSSIELANKFNISRQRIHQIEVAAMKKVTKAMLTLR